MSVPLTYPCRSSITAGCLSMAIRRIARVSGCEAVMKSRFRSKPLALARVPAIRPSGLAVTLRWIRLVASRPAVFASLAFASSSMSFRAASVPSHSLPWMLLLMKTGVL